MLEVFECGVIGRHVEIESYRAYKIDCSFCVVSKDD